VRPRRPSTFDGTVAHGLAPPVGRTVQ